MLLAAFGFAWLGLLVKVVAPRVPPGEIVLWRSLGTGAVIFATAAGTGRLRELTPVRWRMHAVRAAVGVASMACYFSSIARLGLGDAVLLTYLSPLIVAGLSPVVLGERASPKIWGALGLGLVGVAFVVGPAWRMDPLGVAFGLAGAWLAAGAYVSVRVLNRTETPISVVWWFSVIGAALASVSLVDGAAPVRGADLARVLTIGAVGALAQWALTMAYRQANAAAVSVFAYATPVFAYLAGLVFLHEVPGPGSLLGVGLVAAAGWIAARD